MSLQQKRERALTYLRARGIYAPDGVFIPTDSWNTNVRETMARATPEHHALGRSVMAQRVTRR